MTKFFAILLALIAPPAIYFPTLGAKRDAEIAHLDAAVRDLDMRYEQARAAQRKMTQFQEERVRLDEERTKLRNILPPTIDIDELHRFVEDRADAANVRLTKFDAAVERHMPPPDHQSIDAEILGDAAATSGFFERLANMSRIVNVTHVTMRPDRTGWRTGFVISTYALPD